MLIKINESDEKFIKIVEELKQHYREATASGATKKAIINHVAVCAELKKAKQNIERLEEILAEIKDIRHQQKSLEQALSIMID
tara:strand:+ start:1438 stop:1686 length:249 start_codon:yes stop_codon:yes gene_type:complete